MVQIGSAAVKSPSRDVHPLLSRLPQSRWYFVPPDTREVAERYLLRAIDSDSRRADTL
jgi:hypothetical protein